MRRINPDEERKLTGTGTYNIEAYADDDDYDGYSDDFESDDDDDESNSSILTDGCSGTTIDTPSRVKAQANSMATQAKEMQRVVEAYNMILENTVSDDHFSQYKPGLESIGNSGYGQPDFYQQNANSGNGEDTLPRSLSHSESQPINIKPMSQRLEEQKEYIRQQMGPEVYEKVLRVMQMHKQHDSESQDVHESLKPILGKNRTLRDLCFSLEMIVWKEQ